MAEKVVNNSKREFGSMVDSLRYILKTFNQTSKSVQIRLPQLIFEIGSTKSKDNTHYYKDIIEVAKRQSRLSVCFEKKTILASSPSKCMDYTIISYYTRKLPNFTIAKLITSTQIRYSVAERCGRVEKNYDV